jgi:hypothetical protein
MNLKSGFIIAMRWQADREKKKCRFSGKDYQPCGAAKD